MEVRALGPLAVLASDGTEADIGGAKPRALLMLLALRAGEIVPAEQIIEELWGDQATRDPLNALQAIVSKLRRALQPSDALVTRTPGYLLDIDPSAIDIVRFERGAAEGRRLLDDGNPEHASAVLRDALGLWRGDALVDFTYDSFAQAARLRLEELRVAAIEDRIDADLALGRHEALAGELDALVALHPLRERLHAQLLLALYRSGRQADALRAYQSARTTLADELGIDPGPELRRLEAAILAQDPSLDPVGRPVAPARATGNLPPSLSSFVGRRDELEEVGTLVGERRMVTIVGPGGVGKTRIAIEAARGSDTPAWLVELAAVTDPATLHATVANELGLDDIARIDQFLAGRRVLVVLDNCEHLIDHAARIAEQLLKAGDGVRVLATSRERLGVPGETVWTMPPMAPDDAEALFAERAMLTASVADSPELVQQICARLDGLPLAVELAAARTRTLALLDIANRLDDRFRLLTGGDRTAAPRLQTLRGVVDWSYDLLFAEEQAVFRRLSVFVGGFGIDGAEAVCAGDDVLVEDVVDLLGHLVDKSLVQVVERHGATRYRLLESLVEYGLAELARADDVAPTRDRHLAWALQQAVAGESGLRGREQRAWTATLAAEQPNVRTALDWAIANGRADDALTIAGSMGYAWYLGGWVLDGYAAITAALAVEGGQDSPHRAAAESWAGWLALIGARNTPKEGVEHLERALVLARACSSKDHAIACTFLANVRRERGLGDEELALFEEATARLRAEPDPWASALIDEQMMIGALRRGATSEAAERAARSVRGYEEEGDDLSRARVLEGMGELAERRGDTEEATRRSLEAYEIVTTGFPRAYQASVLALRLGNVAMLERRLDDAASWHERALEWAREGAYPRAEALALNGMGIATRRRGLIDDAERLHQDALAIYLNLENVAGQSLALASLGYIAALRGDVEGATTRHFESLTMALGFDPRATALAIEGLAETEAMRGEGLSAAILLGVAGKLRRHSGGELSPAERDDVERTERLVLSLVDAGAMAEALDHGAADAEGILARLAKGELPRG